MATVTNIQKNRFVPGSGGTVFFGWLFLFTLTSAATGPTLANITKQSGSLINVPKN